MDWEKEGYKQTGVMATGATIYEKDGRFWALVEGNMRALSTISPEEMKTLGISTAVMKTYLTREKPQKALDEFKRGDQMGHNGKDTTEIVSAEPVSLAPRTSMSIVRPVVKVEEAIEAWNDFQKIKQKLITEDDKMQISGKTFIKKSGWRKVSTVFNLSDMIISETKERNPEGRIIYAEFTVRVTAPNGRVSEGWGSCSASERGHTEDKKSNRGEVTCKGPCDGLKHFAHPDHDIPATSHTRAKNRAISDICGSGEVSAEEIE